MKIIKTAIFFLFLILSSASIANEINDKIDATVTERLNTDNAQSRDKSNQINCLALGNEFAVKLNKTTTDKYGVESELQCQTTDEYATYSFLYDTETKFLVILIAAISIIYLIIYVYNTATGIDPRQSKLPSLPVFLSSLGITILLIVPTHTSKINGVEVRISLLNNIIANGLKKTTTEVNAVLENNRKNQEYYFSEIYMPHLDLKADVMEALFDFLLSASSTNKNTDIQFIAIEKEGKIVVETYNKQYVGIFTLGYDAEAVEIAKENNMLDYRAYTIEKQKLALQKSLTYLQSAVENYGTSINKTSDKNTFKLRDFDCSVIPTMDIRSFTKISLSALYTKKAAICASEIYLTELYRFNGYEQKEYLNNQNYLANRKLELCVHGEEGKNKFSYAQVKAKAKQCLQEACGASGSLYFCSAAIRINDSLNNSKSEDLADIFEFFKYYFTDNGLDFSKGGEVFGNEFYFEYMKLDDDFVINSAVDSLFRITLPTTDKVQFVENSFLDSLREIAEDISNEIVGVNFSSISIDNLVDVLFTFGSDGFLGSKRLEICLQYPNQYLQEYKYNCKGNFSELIQNGRLVFTTTAQALAFKIFLNFKTGKTKEVSAAEITGIQKMTTDLMGSKVSRTLAFITASSYANDIHNQSLKDAENQLENVGIFSSILFSDAQNGFVNKILWSMLLFGFILFYLIPWAVIYYSLKALAEILTNFLMYLKTSHLQVLNSFLSNKHKAPNLDLPDWLVYGLAIILSVIVLLIAFTVVLALLNNAYAILPADFINIISGTIEQKGGVDALREFIEGKFVFAIFTIIYLKYLISLTVNIGVYSNLFVFNQGKVDHSNDSAIDDSIENDKISSKFWSK